MAGKKSDRNATRNARGKPKQAEKGDTGGAEELAQAGTKDEDVAVSVEQEASEGPEGRGLTR
jgi:hypothetical protein